MEKEYDVVIIGAGIAGITAGIYLRRSSLKAVMLDKGAPGGKLNNIHRIDNYPACPSISGPDLAVQLFNQAMELGVNYEYASVFEVAKEGNLFKTRTDVGDIVSKAVIVATGSSPKKLGIPGEKDYLGKGVSYCATCDGNFFKGLPVAVYGYLDHAVEDTLYLAGLCSKVHFLAPKPIQSTEEHLGQLKALENVEIVLGATMKSIEGDNKVQEVVYELDGVEKRLPVRAIFPLADEKSSSEFLAGLNPNTNKGFLICDSNMQTSVPGLFACGDIVDKRLRQLVNAAGEAAVAATASISYVRSV